MSHPVRSRPDHALTPADRPNPTGGPLPAAGEGPDVSGLLHQIGVRLARIEELIAERQRVRDHYSTGEVANILGKSEFTVREWCRLGRVRAAKKQSGRGKHPAWVIADAELKRIQKEGLLPL